MANEITSMTSLVSRPASPVNDSSQFAKLEAVSTSTSGNNLPTDGKVLPQQPAENKPKLQEAVNQINAYVQTVQRDLSFSMDDDSGQTVIKVIDTDSGELIRQIPSEEVIALATYLNDAGSGSAVPGSVSQGILFF